MIRSIAMPSRNHHTASLERPLRPFGLAKGTPLSLRIALGRGTVGSFVLRPCQSLSDEPIAEDDGELGPGLEPLARRPFPFVGLAIKDPI